MNTDPRQTNTSSIPRFLTSPVLVVVAGVALVGVCIFYGSRHSATRYRPRAQDSNAEVQQAADTDFQVAFDFISNYHRFDASSVGERITYHLQRWVVAKQPDPDWIADPLISRLPQRFVTWQEPGALSELRFDVSAFDVMILRESIWAHDLAQQIDAARLHDERLNQWLSANTDGIDPSQLQELTTAAKIFDWVVRNIQLETLPYVPAELPEGATEDEYAVMTPPDGAMYLPAEALILGRGDWIARTRVASLIARQAGLATAVLAVDEDESAERPWCWAVLIGGELYLFDFRLGLAVPREGGEGIVTLGQLVDEPELLRQLDLEQDDLGPARTYPISAEDLKRAVALIDATPESLSQRMKIVERQLTGDQKLVLTTAPSAFAVDLRKSRGITGARLWTMAFDAYLFRQEVNRAVRRSLAGSENLQAGAAARIVLLPPPMVAMRYDMSLVDGSGPKWASLLSQARRQHFRGVYADSDSEKGAKSAYMACRIPDSEIDQDVDLEELYEQGVIPELPKLEDRVAVNRVIAGIRAGMREVKEHASFWLGLIAYDEGNYPVAVNYLEKRTLAKYPDGPWTPSATYNLARAYEQWGLERDDSAKVDKSRELLRSLKKTPQTTGNRLRAAR